MEIAHNVSLLLPHMDCFLEFHFPLEIKRVERKPVNTPEEQKYYVVTFETLTETPRTKSQVASIGKLIL